jgi:hypothetical protein
MKYALLIFALWIGGFGVANAYCTQPQHPPQMPNGYDKPRAPDCLRQARLRQDSECSAMELSRYDQAVDRYVNMLVRYSKEAQAYAMQAQKYAICEADEARREQRR